jgi:hypothetical protein
LGSRIAVEELQIGARQQGGHGHVYAAKWRASPVAVKEMIHTASEEQIQEELKGLMYVMTLARVRIGKSRTHSCMIWFL